MTRKLTPTDIALWAALPMAHTTHIEGRLKMILDTTRPRRALTRRALLLALTPGIAALATLAMLRPSAKAQAAPAPVAAQPPAIAPTPPVAVPLTQLSVGRRSHQAPAVTAPNAPVAAQFASRASLKPVPAAPSPKSAPSPARSPQEVASNLRVPVLADIPILGRLFSGRVAQLSPTAPSSAAPSSAAPDAGALTEKQTAPQAGDVTVELAGVKDLGTPSSPWWDATGTPLPSPVFDTESVPNIHEGADMHNVYIAFRLPAGAQGVTVQYDLPKNLPHSNDDPWLTKTWRNAQGTEAQLFPQTNGARVLIATFPISLKKTSLRVGIASGVWKTASTDSIGPNLAGSTGLAGNTGEKKGAKFLFRPVLVTRDNFSNGVSHRLSLEVPVTRDVAVLSVSTDTTDDLRVVAMTTQGQTVLPDEIDGPLKIGGNSIGTMDKITARFSLPLAQIKEFRVETRAFRWVEFKDVALQPAK